MAGKLIAPARRPGILGRPALVDRLVESPLVPVVLLSAPAGYGKTTLLSLWRDRDERPFAWVTLDSSDNDRVVLLTALVHALEPFAPVDGIVHEALATRRPLLDEVVVPALVEAVVACEQPFVLALDDTDLLLEQHCFAVLDRLARHLPPGSQLALATRTDPAIGLAGLRAHGRLLELRASDLRLSPAEVGEVLAAGGTDLSGLSAHRLEGLVQRTEGWPAGVYLAALSLRGRLDADDFLDGFAGSSRHVADFLSEDVLARQPEDVTRFLLRTCLLGEMTADLCNAVTGDGDAEQRLRHLEDSNLFVVPLDEERRAYRYHHLFAQYLQAELKHREPDLVPELHRRAWRWNREHGHTGRAIAHARASGDVEAAATMVGAEYAALLDAGNIETVRRWLAGFDEQAIATYPPLAIAAAWVATLSGETDRAVRWAELARGGTWEGPLPDGSASTESALAMLSTALRSDSVAGMRDAAHRAAQLEQAGGRRRGEAVQMLGVALALAGDLDPAEELLLEASGLAGDQSTVTATSLAQLAAINVHNRSEDRATAYAEQAHALVDNPPRRTDPASVTAIAVYSHVLLGRGDVDGANREADRACAILPRLPAPFWWLAAEAEILLAPTLAALGRVEEAVRRLEDAATRLAGHPDAAWLHAWHTRTASELGAGPAAGAGSTGLSHAEQRVMRLLASDLSLREIGRELCLSLNTVKTHTHSIYRKLDVTSRSDAVRACRLQRTTQDGSPG